MDTLQTVYLICALVGGTVLVCQFLLTLVGLAGGEADGVDHGGGFDAGHDVSLGADHDAGLGAGQGVALEAGHGAATDVGHQLGPGSAHDAGAAGDHSGAGHPAHGGSEHGSSWFFRVITFRSVVAALTFFGLGGLAASAGGMSPQPALLVAVGSGGGALYAVAWMMRALGLLYSEGTVSIQSAVGRPATVYLPVPPARRGPGKVTVTVQDRMVEYEAVTACQEELPTGARVSVVAVAGPRTVEVAPIADGEGSVS